MSPKALTALLFMMASLLVVVALVGLARNTLDVTGVAVVLVTFLTGTVGAVVLREKNRNGGDK